jgi:cytochrome c-type biogenesis protein CcmH
MVMLILLAVLLLGATVWWLSRSLRVVPSGGVVANTSADLELLRDRLLAQMNELDAERSDRGIDPVVAQDEELRLSAELAHVLRQLEALSPAATAATTASTPGSTARTVLSITALLMLGAGLYLTLNFGNLQGFWLAAQHGGAEAARVPPMVYEMVAKLEKRLADQPNDATGWAKLGRSYNVMQQPDKALNAYARAYVLAPDNLEVVSEYAWLLFNSNPGETTGLVSELYHRLEQLAPNHPDALWFLGYAAYQQGNYRQTLPYWERLLKLLPPEDPGREHLKQAIASARSKAKK